MTYPSYPNLPAILKTYVDGLESFPVDRTKAVRYGITDTKETPLVEFNDSEVVPDQWTTCGPTQWVCTFTVSCFAKTQQEAYTLAVQVNDLFAGQAITENTFLCEPVGLKVVQENWYKFHAELTYRLQENAQISCPD